MKEITAVCPGSFDPVTLGHLDIITRASRMFSKVIVVVVNNTAKTYSFTVSERAKMLRDSVKDIANVSVAPWEGLLADFAREAGAGAIVKGLRAVSDFEYEFQLALINKKLYPDAETVFLTTRSENMFLSSSVVKDVAKYGGDICGFVPGNIHGFIVDRLSGKNG